MDPSRNARRFLCWHSLVAPVYSASGGGQRGLRALRDIRALPLLLKTTACKARGRSRGVGQLGQPVMPSPGHRLCNPWRAERTASLAMFPACLLLSPCRGLRRLAVDVSRGEEGPEQAGICVGQGPRNDRGAAPCPPRLEPDTAGGLFPVDTPNDCPGALQEQATQSRIPSCTHPPPHGLASRAVVGRYQPEPGRTMPAVLAGPRSVDGGPEGRSRQGPPRGPLVSR